MTQAVGESHYDLLRDAIFDNNVERFEELMAAPGVDPDHFDAGGQTLLHLASFWGRMPIVKVLLNAGASLKVKNAASCTALDLAIHWGHSSVAEIIRLRGGRSVWEEKMGQLQIRVEDLKLMNAQVTQQWQEKRKQYDDLLIEFHALHKRYEEEKSDHFATKQNLDEVDKHRTELEGTANKLRQQLADLTEEHRATLIEKIRTDYLREEAARALQAAFAHRDEVLASMQVSIKKQEELAKQWQQAEMAAAMADSQRNFALADKEKLHKQHTAALGELLLTTERLHAAEQELMMLRVELAEYIYGKERDSRVIKRAAKYLQRKEGITLSTEELRHRPITTPADRADTNPVDNPEPLGPVLNAKKKAQFSAAARDFGDQLRRREQRKSTLRERKHQEVENQYLAEGLSAPIIPIDKFQKEFASTLSAFSTARQEKWTLLQHDRDRQLSFAKNVAARRSITTAPVPFRERGQHRGDATISDGGTSAEQANRSSLAPLRRKKSMNFGVYGEENVAVIRPATTYAEQRLISSFFQSQ